MVKFFKIIEKTVWAVALLAMVAVMAILFIAAYDKMQVDWSSFLLYFYIAVAVVIVYKTLVWYYTSYYQTKIERKTGELSSLVEEQKKIRTILQDYSLLGQKLDAITDALSKIPTTDTNAIVNNLQERLPDIVRTMVDQQVAEYKERYMLEYKKRLQDINIIAANVAGVVERREFLLEIQREIKLHEEEERKNRLALTIEYTMLVFSLAGTPVEDVEKVCDVVKLFIETGQVAANKDLYIPLNKKLRNAELKQFVYNIIRYNGKENLDAESFLQTAFCEWFSGKKENIAKNYSMLPKDSLVSKDGVEADLTVLRNLVGKNER